ncbi:Polynucleotidyl transferase, ribonuclease H superfamily protein [Trifolium repens]|nr:Polynucleotidyl transferase, ribonuclease H superfamily protein [Trifolium repens]
MASFAAVCGCGGLIRGNEGAWLGGFAKGLGECRVMVAELWGAFEGLKLAWERGYKKVELQLDAQNVVKVINKDLHAKAEDWSLCKKIWRLLEMEWEVRIRHTYRKANRCADVLAHMRCDLGSTMIIYESCPTQLSQFMLADAFGTSVPRVVNL